MTYKMITLIAMCIWWKYIIKIYVQKKNYTKAFQVYLFSLFQFFTESLKAKYQQTDTAKKVMKNAMGKI